MMDFELKMQDELDDFYSERERHNNLKLLLDFDSILTNYGSKEIKLGEPKMKKKLIASKFIPKRGNNKSLF
jgi:hypothetical protein